MFKKLKKLISRAKPKKKLANAKAILKKKAASKPKKKIAVRKPAKKAAAKRSPAKRLIRTNEPVQKPVGKVTHFYGGIKVAVVKFSAEVKKGTEVRFKGATTDFAQKLESMQYEHEALAKTLKGKQVGVKVKKRVREGDMVFRV